MEGLFVLETFGGLGEGSAEDPFARLGMACLTLCLPCDTAGVLLVHPVIDIAFTALEIGSQEELGSRDPLSSCGLVCSCDDAHGSLYGVSGHIVVFALVIVGFASGLRR